MDVSQLSSVMSTGASAAGTVATSLAHKGGAAKPTAKATSATDTSNANGAASAAGGSSNITANDFLTLLVSELKNQDPTQPTDPNQYISQLVGVNSLQQLISINKGLTSIETPAGASSPITAPAQSTIKQ